jgi:hypothetical protein
MIEWDMRYDVTYDIILHDMTWHALTYITSHHITGVYSATLCDHRLTALNGIAPVALCVHNHDMSAHIEALRAIKTISTRSKPRWQVTLFLQPISVCMCLSVARLLPLSY